MAEKSLRKERMASVIHSAVASFFVEEGREWGIEALPMVDQVFVSPDLHNVQIWISFAPWKADKAKYEFEVVEKHLGAMKKFLAGKVDLRRFPDIILKLSDPEKTFRMIDILGTISGHGQPDQPDQGSGNPSEEDFADGSR